MSDKVIALIENPDGGVAAVQFADRSTLRFWEDQHPDVFIMTVAPLVTRAAILEGTHD